MFRTAEMVKLYCVFPRAYTNAVLRGLQEMGLVQFFDVKEELKLQPLAISMGPLPWLFERADSLVASLIDGKLKLGEMIFGAKAVPVRLVGGDEKMEMDNAAARFGALEKEYEGLSEQEMLDFARRHRWELLALREEFRLALERMNVLRKLGSTGYTVVLGCWVPKSEVERASRGLERFTERSCSIKTEPPGSSDSVPTHFENPSFLKPFELFATGYGVPKYGGIDPTPLIALTFTLFFGIMFADLGYGAVLATLNSLAFLKTRKAERVQRDFNMILFFCGLSAMVFGFLSGEIFGGLVELEHPPLGRHIHIVEHVLGLALFLGVMHISISIASRCLEPMRGGEEATYLLALAVMLWSGAALYLPGLMDLEPFIPNWIFLLAKISMGIGLIFLIRDKGTESFHELIALAANVLSYSRIGVIATLHITTAALIVNAVRSFSGSVLGIILGIVIFLLGAAFILVLGTFVTFVHALRLHWLEFFKRFYSGFGESFKPFRAERRYTYLL